MNGSEARWEYRRIMPGGFDTSLATGTGFVNAGIDSRQ
jgi:hypothetical protein